MKRLKRSPLRKYFTFFFLFLSFSPLFLSKIVSCQTQHSLYLNKIGECNFVVGYDVSVTGNYAYVTNNDGIMIVDITDPSRPAKVSEILTDQPIVDHRSTCLARELRK